MHPQIEANSGLLKLNTLKRGSFIIVQQIDPGGIRLVHSDDPFRTFAMKPEQAEWIVETGLQQQFDRRIHLDFHSIVLV